MTDYTAGRRLVEYCDGGSAPRHEEIRGIREQLERINNMAAGEGARPAHGISHPRGFPRPRR